MVRYIDDILTQLRKGQLPKEVFLHFNNAFAALDLTKDLSLFDIRQLRVSEGSERAYYRLRKGKYRAIFYIEHESIFVIALDKREEVYKKWQ